MAAKTQEPTEEARYRELRRRMDESRDRRLIGDNSEFSLKVALLDVPPEAPVRWVGQLVSDYKEEHYE